MTTQQEHHITAFLVDESQYSDYLSTYFGQHFSVQGEAMVYVWLFRLSKMPIQWTRLYFYTLSNGGFYLAPNFEQELRIKFIPNNLECKMSTGAVGIVATLFTLRELAVRTAGTPAAEKYANHYHSLGAYATMHAEAVAIYRAID